MGKMKEAYSNEEKAPRKGIKAQDQDEYQASGSNYDKSVSKSQAYGAQDKAPKGRGSRGPSQADGGPIKYWNQSVEKGDAYEAQCKWGDSDNNQTPSLGFKLPSENAGYLGHFAQEKYLREGHNDGPSWGTANEAASDESDAAAQMRKDAELPDPEPRYGRKAFSDEAAKDTQKSMRKAFNYGDDD